MPQVARSHLSRDTSPSFGQQGDDGSEEVGFGQDKWRCGSGSGSGSGRGRRGDKRGDRGRGCGLYAAAWVIPVCLLSLSQKDWTDYGMIVRIVSTLSAPARPAAPPMILDMCFLPIRQPARRRETSPVDHGDPDGESGDEGGDNADRTARHSLTEEFDGEDESDTNDLGGLGDDESVAGAPDSAQRDDRAIAGSSAGAEQTAMDLLEFDLGDIGEDGDEEQSLVSTNLASPFITRATNGVRVPWLPEQETTATGYEGTGLAPCARCKEIGAQQERCCSAVEEATT
ncbi:hypothetical protein F5883DRAFT_688647 [Diaporthe sp. PMI_573]|nr:hypothetical protein F5883DRAFT_688647 [Diaporthaceae sp. PMI_573]